MESLSRALVLQLLQEEGGVYPAGTVRQRNKHNCASRTGLLPNLPVLVTGLGLTHVTKPPTKQRKNPTIGMSIAHGCTRSSDAEAEG